MHTAAPPFKLLGQLGRLLENLEQTVLALVMTFTSKEVTTLCDEFFCIAGINVGISGCSNYDGDFLSSFEIFRTKKFQDADIVFRFAPLFEQLQYPASDFYIDPLCFHKSSDILTYFTPDFGDAKVSANASMNWDDIEIVSNTNFPITDTVSLMTDIAFRTKLPSFSGFSLHSSIVEINGSSILFVGPSGIGKSTQAELWREHLGASIINGDYGIIRQTENGFHVYGSPWSGTSPYKMNTDSPVSAVILLKQSETNQLNRLERFDMMQGFLPNCLLPYWHKPSLEPALDVINSFLQAVPVYELKCRPDYEAVEMAREVLTI